MFRYRDAQGIEKRLLSDAELQAAIRDGRIHANTPLAMGDRGVWDIAGHHPTYKRSGKPQLAPPPGARRSGRQKLARLARSRRARWGTLVGLVVIAGLGFIANVVYKRGHAEQRLEYVNAMLGIADGRTPAPELLAEPAPEPNDGALRTAWVRLQVANTVWQRMEAAQINFGVRGFHPPAAWMSDDYVTNARAFPDVGAHWDGYLAWDRNWSPDAWRLLNQENARRAAEAELTERQTFELIDPAQPGLSSVGWDLELRRQFAAEAARLHTTLVESRGNAFIDNGAWWFADTRTQRTYAQHVQNLRRIGELLQANAAKRAAALGVEPGDGAVPAGLARMRPAGG
ncbi:MAG TPA: hypothetical protein VMN78_00025 [Longimicrobiales bacterium]|nr:hypothetical protein [Longimicrobiales bacterium]